MDSEVNNAMRILVIGAGAVGGYYGARLAQAKRDVTFLVREARAAQLRQRGLRILSPHGNAVVQPKLLTAAELNSSPQVFDLILLSTKAYSLEAAMDDFAPAVGPRTAILPLLNGIRHLDSLVGRFGKEHILGGSTRIVADLTPEGDVHQMTELGELLFGDLSAGKQAPFAISPSLVDLEEIRRELSVPGYDVTLAGDILGAMWQKWWFLSSLGAICILGDASIGQVSAVPYGAAMARAIVEECVAISAANGYPAHPKVLADHIDRMTEKGSPLTSSMYRDMSKGGPVEADHIFGDLLARADGVFTPLLAAAYVRTKVYENSRA